MKERTVGQRTGKALAQTARAGLAIPGHVGDMGLIAINPILGALGKEQFPSQADEIKRLFDRYTDNYATSETDTERNIEAFLDFTAPGLLNKFNAIGKGTTKVAKAVKEFLRPTLGGAAGAVASQEVLNKAPGDYLKAYGTGLGVSTALGGVRGATRNIADKTRLSRVHNPNALDKILSKVAERQGLGRSEHSYLGEKTLKAAENHKEKYDKLWKERYGKADAYYNKISDKNKNSKRLVDMSSTVDWIADQYKKLESHDAKNLFLKSKVGDKLKRFLNVSDMKDIGSKTSDVDRVDVLIKRGFDRYKPMVPYHEARGIQRDIQNQLSKSVEIGDIEKGDLKQISSRLRDSIGTVFQDDPEMHKYWNKTNDMYVGYLKGDKQRINNLMKYKARPKHDDKGNPIQAFRDTASNILSKEDPRDLKFIINGLDKGERDIFLKGLISEMGTEKGKYSPIRSKEKMTALQKDIHDPLLGGISKKERGNILKQDPLVDQIMYEKQQPHQRATGLTSATLKKIPDLLGAKLPSDWTNEGSINRTIGALERKVNKNPFGFNPAARATRQAENVHFQMQKNPLAYEEISYPGIEDDPLNKLSNAELMALDKEPESDPMESMSNEELMRLAQ